MTNKHENLTEKLKTQLEKVDLLSMKSRAEMGTKILKERLEVVLPWAMQESGLDFWIVAARENCKDPVLKTLYPWDMPDVRRAGILAFYRNPKTNSIRKMAIGPSSLEMGEIYEKVQGPDESIWEAIARIVTECNPVKVAINRSFVDGFSDGLSATMYEELKDALGEDAAKLCDGNSLIMRWLQRVSSLEKKVMQILVNLTQDIIKYSFSKQYIKVGETTTTDIEWFMRDVIKSLGFNYWFGPDVDLQRRRSQVPRMVNEIILPGDLLHCDIGINGTYLQLHTDLQWVAYVLKEGEKKAPKELSQLLAKGNRLQDIVRENMRECVTGNDVFLNSMEKAKGEGLNPMIYTHPLGTFGHGSGPIIGKYDQQSFIPGVGDRVVEDKTCYALELNVSDHIKVWDKQLVYMYLEEDICKDGTVDFLNGRQESLLLV